MRLLVTGASGLLGLNLSLQAMRSHTVIGVDRGLLGSPPFEVLRADLQLPGAAQKVMRDVRAEAVINCAAMADVDACERDAAAARQVNAKLPGELAVACSQENAQLVHISTDAVFDGLREGKYDEADEPHPTSVYGETKLAGEQAVLQSNPQAVVVRVNFYGWSMSGRRSLAEFFFNSLSAGRPVKGFTDVTFCPMYVADLTRVLIKMLGARLRGLFHAVGPLAMTKYEFGLHIARRFGFDPQLITPDSVARAALDARRAHNLNLSIHKLSTVFGEALPDFSPGLEQFFHHHRSGYPQVLRSYQQAAA